MSRRTRARRREMGREMRFDMCRCGQWQSAHGCRRGGQPVRCGECGAGMRRVGATAWMERILHAAGSGQ